MLFPVSLNNLLRYYCFQGIGHSSVTYILSGMKVNVLFKYSFFSNQIKKFNCILPNRFQYVRKIHEEI